MHDTRSHQIEAEIADAGRVRDQGDDYRGIEATNPKNSQQKYGGAWDCRCWTHSHHLPLGLLFGSQHGLSSEHEAEGKMSSTKKALPWADLSAPSTAAEEKRENRCHLW
jgi:hypothetical protein